MPAFFVTFNFLYGISAKSDSFMESHLNVYGYGLLITNGKSQQEHCEYFIGENAVDRFLNTLFVHAQYYLDSMISNQIPLNATAEERKYAKTIKICENCKRDITPQNPVHIDHNHHVEEPNQFLCSFCNKLKYCKRMVYIYTHGLSKNGKAILANISEEGIKQIKIIPQSANDGILAMIFSRKFVFIDAANHLSANFYEMSKSITDLPMLKLNLNDDRCYAIAHNGLSFPSSLITCMKDFEKDFPTEFIPYFDTIIESEVKEYQFMLAQFTFKEARCTNLKEYGLLSLKSNTYALQFLLWDYASWCMATFKIQPLFDFSISSFSFACAHFVSKTNYECLRCPDIYLNLSKSVLGGLSFVNIKKLDCISPRLGHSEEDPSKFVECLSLDYNLFYGSLLGSEIPFSSYYFFTPQEVAVFSWDNFNNDSDVALILCCSLYYPKQVKHMSRWLPFCPFKQVLTKGDILSLYKNNESEYNFHESINIHRCGLNQLDKTDVWISNKLLKLFLDLGMQLKGIKHIISFEVKAHLAKFVQVCVDAKAATTNPIHEKLCKIILNHSFGKFISKSMNEKIVACTTERQATKYLSNSDFINVYPFGNNLVMVALKNKKTLIIPNFLIGFWVLDQSKYIIYRDYYYKIVPAFGPERVSLMALETDQYFLKIVNDKQDFYDNLRKLKSLIDFSRLPSSHELHDQSNKDKPMTLKLEDIYVISFIALRGKQRSMLSLEPLPCKDHKKELCSQCPNHTSRGSKRVEVMHERYRAILEGADTGIDDYVAIKHVGINVMLANKSRKMLSVSDGQRLFINDELSYPIGYEN